MENTIVKNILACLVLAVLCFVVGSLVTESYVASAGVIAMLIGVVFMVFMGTRSWTLLFYLPPLLMLVPLSGALGLVPTELYAGAIVLAYSMVLSCVGYVKLRWRTLWAFDMLVLAMVVIMVASYIRRPVSVEFLGLDVDNIGGAEYVHFVMACTYYLALSCIPIDVERLPKVMNRSVALYVLAAVGVVVLALLGLKHGVTNINDVDGERLYVYYEPGKIGVKAILAYFSIGGIMLNPALLGGLLVSVAGVLITGSRALVFELFLTVVVMCFLKRQLSVLVGLGVAAYGILIVLGTGGVLMTLPKSFQRVLGELPGVNISEFSVQEAQTTWDWREQLWEMAWDRRSGYIKDYMFGDGFGQSKINIQRSQRAIMRGELVYGDLDDFATIGNWHNGVISTIHRIGYVGYAVTNLMLIVGSLYMFKLCISLRGTKLFKPIVFYVAGYVALIPEYYWGAHSVSYVFFNFVSLAIIKLVYCVATEMGGVTPWFRRKRYKPEMIQHYGERIRPPQYM